jgi:succinate-semialdehyde dehydrogenase / glutarate-semialdehyde dehydrogenase
MEMAAVPRPGAADGTRREPTPPGPDRRFIEALRARQALADADVRTPIEVVAPFTGEVVGAVPASTEADIAEAARLARAAQPAWATSPFRDRARIFLRLHDLLLTRQDEVMDLIQLETGKARKDAFEEVADVAVCCRYYAHTAEHHLRSRRRRGSMPLLTRVWEHHHPVGLVGFITPWNYPLSMALSDVAPALMAGNAALVKPDHQTPFTALWAARLADEAGLPRHLLQVVNGDGARIGKFVIDAVDHIAFTGSTAVGRIVATQAAERLMGCSLELGGKNAMVVLDDADLDAAADAAVRGCFSNAGQLCVSMERILVHQRVFNEFSRRFVERTRRMRMGADSGWDTEMGCLVSNAQLERVRAHYDDAVAKGARVLCGGRPRLDLGPTFFEATVLTDVTEDMLLFDQETFGPIVALYPFATDDDAVERVNASRYGLNAAVWSRHPRRAHVLARRIQAGTVNINETYAAAWSSVDAPMGGFKESGLGRRHGAEGILRYTETQTVARQRLLQLGPSKWLDGKQFRTVATLMLKALRQIPWIR